MRLRLLRSIARLDARLLVRVLLFAVMLAVMLGCALRVCLGTTPGQTAVASRHAVGQLALVDDYMAYGFWFGCLFTGAAALVLLVTSRWWSASGEIA